MKPAQCLHEDGRWLAACCRYDHKDSTEDWVALWVIPWHKRELIKTCWVTSENFPGRIWQEMHAKMPKQCKIEFEDNLYQLPAENLKTHPQLYEGLAMLWRKRGDMYNHLKQQDSPYPTKEKALQCLPQVQQRMSLQMQLDDADCLREAATDGSAVQVMLSSYSCLLFLVDNTL